MTNARFLRVNGYPIPAVPGSSNETPTYVGELGPSRTNRPQRRRRAISRKEDFTSKPLSPLQSDTIEGILNGKAYHWPFDFDAFAAVEGLGPEVGGVYSITQNDGLARFGYGYLDVTGGSIVFDVRTRATAVTGSGKLTVSYWRATVAGEWDHITIRTRDAAKWLNGIRADATVTTELTVGSGGIALSDAGGATFFDDLVVMLYDVDDSYPGAFYDWTSAFGLESWWRFNETPPIEEFSGAVGFTSGVPTIVEGIVGTGLNFAGVALADVPNSTLSFITGSSIFSFSLWVNRDSGSAQMDMLSIYAGAANDMLRIRFNAADQIEVVVEESNVVAPEIFTTSEVFAQLSEWIHIGIAVDLASNLVLIFVNGLTRSTTRTGRAISGTFTEVVTDVEFGRDAATGPSYLQGTIDEYRAHSRLLDDSICQEIYRRGLLGLDPLAPTPASDFPRVLIDGQIIESERFHVDPIVTNEPYATFGSTTGFENAARIISGELEESIPKERLRVPQPFFMALMDESDIVGGVIDSVVGDFPGTITGGTTNFGRVGPYLQNESALFGASPNFIDYGSNVSDQLFGAESISCAVWVRHNVTGVSQMIVHAALATTSSVKMMMQYTTSSFVSFAWDNGTSSGTQTTAAAIPADGEFHLVIGTINLRTKIARVFVDGALSSEAVKAISGSRFDNVSAGFRIGQRVDGTQQLSGWLAACYVYRRELSKGEANKMFKLGRKGILR